MAEAANVINKKRMCGELNGDESDRLLADLLAVPVRLFPHKPVLLQAFKLAREHNITVYDTLYLALAEDHGAVIYSADRKLLKTAAHLRLV